MSLKLLSIFLIILSAPVEQFAQKMVFPISSDHIFTQSQLDSLFLKPDCLTGYLPNQSGYLSKSTSDGTHELDTTFTIEQLSIRSGSVLIHGWLYLPSGTNRHPLIVLTSGGGNGPQIRSFPDWIAPTLAHCGIAAFVYDKRGTGKSESVFKETSYDDYINDAGNCAKFLSNHPRVSAGKIGVLGGSEGGRVAVLAASRFSEIQFAISYAGAVVDPVKDRLFAQKSWLQSMNLPDSVFQDAWELHEKSILAWASQSPDQHALVDKEIMILREKYDRKILPSTKKEMESTAELENILPTWNSLSKDYLSELRHFNKEWLAIFGELDQRVPVHQSINNMIQYMTESGNRKYWIALIPNCGHAPVNQKTQRLVRLDHLILHWIHTHII